MRCIDCTESATHWGRCEGHHRGYERHASVRTRGFARRCWPGCSREPRGSVALVSARGGEDTDEKAQLLSHCCHLTKTDEDFRVTKPPF